MAKKSTADSSGIRMTREKETFKLESIVNIDGTDVKCYVKCSTNFERLTYKVSSIVTLVHDWSEDVRDTFDDLIHRGVEECKKRLSQYREESGIGTQGDLFGEPAEAE